MATDIEKLVVQLSADVRSYQREMQKARDVNNRTFNAIRKKALDSSRAVEAAIAQAGRKITGVFAAIGSARGAQQLVDSATRIQNALKVAGLSGSELTAVYDKLYAAAQRNSAPIEGLVTLYSRVSLAQKDLGVSSEQIVTLSDNVGKALRLSGSSAEESSGALLQLSQALGGGVLQAEEYNSLIDGLPGILQAAAAGIKEAGGSVSTLTRLVKDGQVSSKAFFDGIEAGAPVLDKRLAGSVQTIDQKLIGLKNALLDAALRFNENSTAASTFGKVIDDTAASIDSIDFSELIGQINAVVTAFSNGASAAQNFFVNAGKATGFDNLGKDIVTALGGEGGKVSYLGGAFEITSSKIVEDRIAGAFDQVDQTVSDLTADAIQKYASRNGDASTKTDRVQSDPDKSTVIPISLADYSVAGKSKKSGSSSAKETSESRFEDDLQAVRDRTAALVDEQKILGLSYQEQERRRMALDLEQSALADLREEARKKGQVDLDSIKLSEDQRAKIEATSAAYAEQAEVLRKLEDQQARNEQAAGEFYDAFKSGAMDAITGAQDLGEALSGLADKFADLLLNSAFDSLFKPSSGDSSGGIFGSLFSGLGSLLSGGVQARAKGGPVSAGKPYVVGEKRAELFVPSTSGQIIPQVPTMSNLSGVSSGSSTTHVSFAPSYNVTGTGEDIAALRRQMAKDRAEFPSRAVAEIQKAQKRGVKV